MAKHYKEAPWWWYGIVLLASFILGLIVVLKENITLPAWAYVVAMILGIIIAPFVSSIHDHQVLPGLANKCIERSYLCTVWQRHCNQQLIQDDCWPDAPWPSHW